MDLRTPAELEKIPSSDRESFTVREFRLREFPSPWHFHLECELCSVIRGHGQRLVGDHVDTFGPGDMVLVGSALPHVWRSRRWSPGEPEDAAHSVVVQFREDCLGSEFWNLREVAELRSLMASASRGIQVFGSTRDEVRQQMLSMRYQVGLQRLITLLEILRLLARCTDVRLLSSPGFEPTRDHPVSKRLDQVYRYIAAHASEPWDHRALAKELRMSASCLSHFFKRTTGRTLTSAVAEYRIGQACHLLATTDLTVSEIVYACGFQSISPFQVWFQRLRGMKPQEFRKQQGLRLEPGLNGRRKQR
jgi:AraC-like DNA-binding protein